MEGVSSNGAGPGSRAERFDDEKRRIIDSVFGKKDKDGQRKRYLSKDGLFADL